MNWRLNLPTKRLIIQSLVLSEERYINALIKIDYYCAASQECWKDVTHVIDTPSVDCLDNQRERSDQSCKEDLRFQEEQNTKKSSKVYNYTYRLHGLLNLEVLT